MNGMVIIACSVIYKSVESALYAIIVQYLTGVVLNAIVDGSDRQKEGLIITSKPEEMAKAILENLQRGCTGIEGKGMYTNEEKTLLLVVVRRHEISALKSWPIKWIQNVLCWCPRSARFLASISSNMPNKAEGAKTAGNQKISGCGFYWGSEAGAPSSFCVFVKEGAGVAAVPF